MSEVHSVDYGILVGADMKKVREVIRNGQYCGHTSGLAAGHLQCNLAILPSEYKDDFLEFCLSNPKPCPLAAVSELGVGRVPDLGKSIDIRTDLPQNGIWARMMAA